MPTLHQLTRSPRQQKIRRQKTPALLEAPREYLLGFKRYEKKRNSSPQKKGVCVKVFQTKPKKT
jgi:ribosomal protein S12